jgi:hypothetical protein
LVAVVNVNVYEVRAVLDTATSVGGLNKVVADTELELLDSYEP